MSNEVFQLFEMKGDGEMRPIGTTYPTYLQCSHLKRAVVMIVRKVLPENPENTDGIEAPGGIVPIDTAEFQRDYGIYRQVEGGWEQVDGD